MERLHHVVGVSDLPKNKKCVIIIDESDDIIMRDPVPKPQNPMSEYLN